MSEASNNSGILAALIQRFMEQRGPRLERLNERLDKGEILTEQDITFLKEVMNDAHTNKALIDGNEELQAVVARIMHVYKVIMDKAVENEKKSQS